MQKSLSMAFLQTEANGWTGTIYTFLSIFSWEVQIRTWMKSEDKKRKQKASTMFCMIWNTIIKYFLNYYNFLIYCINSYEGDRCSYSVNCLKFIGFSESNKVKEVTTIYINHEFAPACLWRNFESNSLLLCLRGIDGTVTPHNLVFYALN